MIMKGDLVNQAFDLMRISGLTTKMTPEDMERGLTILERMVLSYENNGLFLSYNKSDTYPTPDASEDSGIADSNVSAIVMLLFKNTCPAYGKQFPAEMIQEADTAYRGLFSTIPPSRAQNQFQPSGQGNRRHCGVWGDRYMRTEEALTSNNNGQIDDVTL